MKKTNEQQQHNKRGRAGGLARAQQIGPVGMAVMGRLGGLATYRTHGPHYFAIIGRRGGDRTLAKYGTAHMARIARWSKTLGDLRWQGEDGEGQADAELDF